MVGYLNVRKQPVAMQACCLGGSKYGKTLRYQDLEDRFFFFKSDYIGCFRCNNINHSHYFGFVW